MRDVATRMIKIFVKLTSIIRLRNQITYNNPLSLQHHYNDGYYLPLEQYSGPHGMIDLASCTTVKSADLKSKKRHSLEISTPETQFLLYADSEVAKDDWIGRVGKAIVRCSRTYYQQPGATSLPNGQQGDQQEDDDDDIYTNDDPDNPYFND